MWCVTFVRGVHSYFVAQLTLDLKAVYNERVSPANARASFNNVG